MNPKSTGLARTEQLEGASTGPRTEAGKAVSRRNAVRHGLTANPTVLSTEDASVYEGIVDDLRHKLMPEGPVEESLVSRIATSLFRLNRAVQVEQAMASVQIAEMPHCYGHVPQWIERFHQCWRWRDEPEQDKEKLALARKKKLAYPGKKWIRTKRTGLRALDSTVREMHESADGTTALLEIASELIRECRRDPQNMLDDDLEKLAAILGDPARCFPQCYEEASTGEVLSQVGETRTRRGIKYELLQALRSWDATTPMPIPVDSELRICMRVLRTQAAAMEDTLRQAGLAARRSAAVLLDELNLARLMRYETQAERSLVRSLQTLASLRGINAKDLGMMLRGVDPDATEAATSD